MSLKTMLTYVVGYVVSINNNMMFQGYLLFSVEKTECNLQRHSFGLIGVRLIAIGDGLSSPTPLAFFLLRNNAISIHEQTLG
ncbi:hypothetical protein BDC45DRAFT_506481 [Circinella umbellata]|nr:hypothetical protein BDC45DRAFT_506481 [Circinella umbellata]